MFLESEVSRLKFDAARALINSGCLKNSWFVDLAIPPQLCLSVLDSCSMCFLMSLLVAKLIGTERQVDEQHSSHQLEAAFKICVLEIEFVSGLV